MPTRFWEYQRATDYYQQRAARLKQLQQPQPQQQAPAMDTTPYQPSSPQTQSGYSALPAWATQPMAQEQPAQNVNQFGLTQYTRPTPLSQQNLYGPGLVAQEEAVQQQMGYDPYNSWLNRQGRLTPGSALMGLMNVGTQYGGVPLLGALTAAFAPGQQVDTSGGLADIYKQWQAIEHARAPAFSAQLGPINLSEKWISENFLADPFFWTGIGASAMAGKAAALAKVGNVADAAKWAKAAKIVQTAENITSPMSWPGEVGGALRNVARGGNILQDLGESAVSQFGRVGNMMDTPVMEAMQTMPAAQRLGALDAFYQQAAPIAPYAGKGNLPEWALRATAESPALRGAADIAGRGLGALGYVTTLQPRIAQAGVTAAGGLVRGLAGGIPKVLGREIPQELIDRLGPEAAAAAWRRAGLGQIATSPFRAVGSSLVGELGDITGIERMKARAAANTIAGAREPVMVSGTMVPGIDPAKLGRAAQETPAERERRGGGFLWKDKAGLFDGWTPAIQGDGDTTTSGNPKNRTRIQPFDWAWQKGDTFATLNGDGLRVEMDATKIDDAIAELGRYQAAYAEKGALPREMSLTADPVGMTLTTRAGDQIRVLRRTPDGMYLVERGGETKPYPYEALREWQRESAEYRGVKPDEKLVEFQNMVRDAARWKGAALNADEALAGNRKARMELMRLTTINSLDDYLMRKYGLDRAAAHNVSNTLTDQDVPADRTAKPEEFAGEPWADKFLGAISPAAPETPAPQAPPAETVTTGETAAPEAPVAPVAEPVPAAPEAVRTAPETPELMTPEQFAAQQNARRVARIEQWNRAGNKGFPPADNTNTVSERIALAERAGYVLPRDANIVMDKAYHELLVEAALHEHRPVSAVAVDEWRLPVPDGYVRDGDMLVYRPVETAGETTTPEATRSNALEYDDNSFDKPVSLIDDRGWLLVQAGTFNPVNKLWPADWPTNPDEQMVFLRQKFQGLSDAHLLEIRDSIETLKQKSPTDFARKGDVFSPYRSTTPPPTTQPVVPPAPVSPRPVAEETVTPAETEAVKPAPEAPVAPVAEPQPVEPEPAVAPQPDEALAPAPDLGQAALDAETMARDAIQNRYGYADGTLEYDDARELIARLDSDIARLERESEAALAARDVAANIKGVYAIVQSGEDAPDSMARVKGPGVARREAQSTYREYDQRVVKAGLTLLRAAGYSDDELAQVMSRKRAAPIEVHDLILSLSDGKTHYRPDQKISRDRRTAIYQGAPENAKKMAQLVMREGADALPGIELVQKRIERDVLRAEYEGGEARMPDAELIDLAMARIPTAEPNQQAAREAADRAFDEGVTPKPAEETPPAPEQQATGRTPLTQNEEELASNSVYGLRATWYGDKGKDTILAMSSVRQNWRWGIALDKWNGMSDRQKAAYVNDTRLPSTSQGEVDAQLQLMSAAARKATELANAKLAAPPEAAAPRPVETTPPTATGETMPPVKPPETTPTGYAAMSDDELRAELGRLQREVNDRGIEHDMDMAAIENELATRQKAATPAAPTAPASKPTPTTDVTLTGNDITVTHNGATVTLRKSGWPTDQAAQTRRLIDNFRGVSRDEIEILRTLVNSEVKRAQVQPPTPAPQPTTTPPATPTTTPPTGGAAQPPLPGAGRTPAAPTPPAGAPPAATPPAGAPPAGGAVTPPTVPTPRPAPAAQPTGERVFADKKELSDAEAELSPQTRKSKGETAVKIRELYTEQGAAQAEAVVQRVQKYGDIGKLFETDDMGRAWVKRVGAQARERVALEDVLQNPSQFDLSGAQEEVARAFGPIYRDAMRVLKDYGVATQDRTKPDPDNPDLPPIEQFVARRTIGFWNPDTRQFDMFQQYSDGKIYPIMPASFQRKRFYNTKEEAVAEGGVYMKTEDALRGYVMQMYRKVGDAMMGQYVIKNIVPVHDQAQKADATLPVAGVMGKGFNPNDKDVQLIEKALGMTGVDKWKVLGQLVASANDLPRMMLATFDVSPALLQNQILLAYNPRVWLKSVAMGIQNFWDKGKNYQGFMTDPIHRETVRTIAKYGPQLGNSEPSMGVQESGLVTDRRLQGDGPLAKAIRKFGENYDRTLTTARILMNESLLRDTMSEKEKYDVVSFVNELTGTVSYARTNASETQRVWENALLFSPRYTRATLALLSDVARGGIKGKQARIALGKWAVAGIGIYLLICKALGQEPNLDPREGGKFLTFELMGNNVGIGGAMYSTLRTGAKMAAETVTGQPGEAVNTLKKYLLSRGSPVTSSIYKFLMREDYIGKPLDTLPELGKDWLKTNLVPTWLQATLEQGALGDPNAQKGEGAVAMLTGITGLRAYPVSAAAERDSEREKYARQWYGKTYDELSTVEKARINSEAPGMAEKVKAAQQIGVEHRNPYSMFWDDVANARQKYEDEIALLTAQLQNGTISGNDYREAVQQRELLRAKVPETLKASAQYRGKIEDYAEEEPTTPVDRFINEYYDIPTKYTDPATGVGDAGSIVRARELLKKAYDPEVVAEAMAYINRNRSPEYVQAQREYAEYQAIPQYLGMTQAQAQAANRAAQTIRAWRQQNPYVSTAATRAAYARYNPEGYRLYVLSSKLGNPERKRFWSQHPLLSKYYSQVAGEELAANPFA